MAWDDIDRDPHPPPVPSEPNREVDESAVLRAIDGHPPTQLRQIDRRAAVARLSAAGASKNEIANRLGVTKHIVDGDRRRSGT